MDDDGLRRSKLRFEPRLNPPAKSSLTSARPSLSSFYGSSLMLRRPRASFAITIAVAPKPATSVSCWYTQPTKQDAQLVNG